MTTLTATQEEMNRLYGELEVALWSLPKNICELLCWLDTPHTLLRTWKVEPRKTFAWVNLDGHMYFRAPLLATLDESQIPHLVAHEAAHAVLLAIGDDWLNEDRVNALAKRWGYDMSVLPS